MILINGIKLCNLLHKLCISVLRISFRCFVNKENATYLNLISATEILKTLPLRIIKKVCLAQNQFHIVMTYHIGYPMRCFDILLGYTINQYCSNYPVDLLLHCIEPEWKMNAVNDFEGVIRKHSSSLEEAKGANPYQWPPPQGLFITFWQPLQKRAPSNIIFWSSPLIWVAEVELTIQKLTNFSFK